MPDTLKRSPNVLIVDDNPADVELIREAFAENGIAACIEVAEGGAQAIGRLRREEPYATAARPDLVLLDLRMPSVDGHQVLSAIKGDPRLRAIPVVVMTSSEHPADVASAYGAAANTYIVKPVQWGRLLNTVKSLEQFWFTAATLPAEPAG
jgi:two-component system, chemotaxis family, response regulator Rcp1